MLRQMWKKEEFNKPENAGNWDQKNQWRSWDLPRDLSGLKFAPDRPKIWKFLSVIIARRQR